MPCPECWGHVAACATALESRSKPDFIAGLSRPGTGTRLSWTGAWAQPAPGDRGRVLVTALLSVFVSFWASSVPELHRSGRSHHLGDRGCRCRRHRLPGGRRVLCRWPQQGTHVSR